MSGRFGQLKAAALLTLDIQRRAVAAGFTLRDASAYNVQFRAGRPILIDTLSFRARRPRARRGSRTASSASTSWRRSR